MKILKRHGIDCPPTKLCSSNEEAVAYVKKRDDRLVCKPCSDGIADAVHIIEHERPRPVDSTQRIYDAIMRIRSLPKSEVPGSESEADGQAH